MYYKTIINSDLRQYAANKGIRLWQVADKYGITDAALSRKMRRDFSKEEAARFKKYVDEIASEIEMRKNQPPELYKQTLVHEIVHGMLTMIGRNDLSEDETFVQSLALAISQTFDLKGEIRC